MDNFIFTHYLLPFGGALAVSFILTILVRALAIKRKIVDLPIGERKIHRQPVPLLGGVAVYLTFLILIIIFKDFILDGRIRPSYLLAIALGGFFLMLGGYLDDKYNLKPVKQIIWPILAALAIIFSGLEINYITNPAGGIINISSSLISGLIVFFWLMGMMYTTKFLDGLDGLVSGLAVIASIILFCVSLFWDASQSGTAILALILGGSALGFLFFNFYPARIFLGEGGSTFLGFALGVVAIISGAKIATTLLIMGLPILDVVWVISRRYFKEKRSAFLADDQHLHFRLLKAGLNQRQAVLILYFIALLFGAVAIFQRTTGKLVALAFLILGMFALEYFLAVKNKKS